MKGSVKGITSLFLLLFSFPLLALNFQSYTKSLRPLVENETSRATLLGIIGSCGNASHLDDDCFIQGLERVFREENNIQAKIIIQDYERALEEGNFNHLECQTEGHMQTNRTIGHCVLLLHYYMIENNDKAAAASQYELCLQGGMSGLAYAGNLAAAFLLTDIFKEKDISHTATLWNNFVKSKKETDEYELFMRCYG